MNKILIFGGSGSLGQAIFKELIPFFDIYSTYFTQNKFKNNNRYFYFNISNDFNDLLNRFLLLHLSTPIHILMLDKLVDIIVVLLC